MMVAPGSGELGFPRQARIIKTDDFSSVFNFRKRVSGRFFAIHYFRNRYARPRLGMVVAKKVVKRAVDRNYQRRVLRELFRTRQMQLDSLDLVVRVQRPFNRADFFTVALEFDHLLLKLRRSMEKISDSTTQDNV